MKPYSRFIPFFIGLMAMTAAGWAEPITTGSLIREMIDMRQLTDYPDPAYKTVQFSSYDHRSTHPGGPDWFANSDGFGNEPVPNFEAVLKKPGDDGTGEYLMCDVKGPGAMVRVWTAAIKGNIRLYLDGSQKPVYDGPAQDFFMKTYAPYLDAAGIEEGVFDGTFSQRNAGYYPIPFAKRCRIVWVGKVKEIHFYQIQIRQYENKAKVKTFTPKDLQVYKEDILAVSKVLADPDGEWDYSSSEAPVQIAASIPAGETKEILSLDGPKAIERLELRIQSQCLDKALKQSILHIVCDGYPWGQVQSPVGDFFGAAPGINPMNQIPFTVRGDGAMISRYVMPCAKSLKIRIENKGDQSVTVTGSALCMDYGWNEKTSMHFRARWRVDHDLVASNSAVQDLPFLIANGQGVYVGTSSILLNPNPVPSSYGNWWGEGDEKIFVDDDGVTTFGTGSEDYYNYAWSAGDIFVHPYFGQPRNDGPANRGFVTNNRWHVLDPLPFENRLSFYMELYSHERTPGVSYARVAYHYAKPGLMDDHLPITGEDVRHLELPENWLPESRMGAGNSVFHQAEALLTGDANSTFVKNNLWAGGQLFVWQPEKRGDEITLAMPIETDGKYTIRLAHRNNPSSGKLSVRLDGESVGFGGESGILDFHVPYRTLLRDSASKTIELVKGVHTLTLISEGPSGESRGREIGLDFIWIQKR